MPREALAMADPSVSTPDLEAPARALGPHPDGALASLSIVADPSPVHRHADREGVRHSPARFCTRGTFATQISAASTAAAIVGT
jgi:hypothetical protein